MKNKVASEEDLYGVSGTTPTNMLSEQAKNHSAFLKYVKQSHQKTTVNKMRA